MYFGYNKILIMTKPKHNIFASIAACLFLMNCSSSTGSKIEPTNYDKTNLPEPYTSKSVKNFSKVLPWTKGRTPLAPVGFTVTKFADDFVNPRWIYEAGNGDIFIAESNTILSGILKFGAKISRKISTQHLGESKNRITLLRNYNKTGRPEMRFTFAENLNQPLGMLQLNNHFYVANTDGLYQFDYNLGDTLLNGKGKKLVDLPAGGYNNHWTRNIIANKAGNKIYITVGSGSNIAEHGMQNEKRRANIIEVNLDGSGERIFASGLRNPVGMGWAPGTNTLFTAVNERDELGNDLVPDYFTSVQEGGFYGWPYSYFGQHTDPRMKDDPRPDMVAKAIIPDVSLGAHTASLGLAFYDKNTFPLKYHNGVFIGQHGSWNRQQLAGYKVMFIPFTNGKPSGAPEEFLTGFIADPLKDEVYGRPVGVTVLKDGSLLVADDVSNIIWRVKANNQQ